MALARAILAQTQRALTQKAAFLLFLPNALDVVVDDGIEFLFHQFNASLLSSVSSPPQKYAKDPLLPPFDPHLHVCDLRDGADHHVIVNKFMHLPGHIVLSSIDPKEEQGTRLNSRDFSAFAQVLASFASGAAYYNSGVESGCTQLHKHIQFAPLAAKPLFDAMAMGKPLPFVYAAARLPDHSPRAMQDAYLRMLEELRIEAGSYNFIVSDRSAVLVPRSSAWHATGLVVNSVGMCGHLAVWEWSNSLIKKKPLSIVSDLAIRRKPL
jgi:ATP adenylyltransferase/5',5'''-P-1,P-4-tetraphosphate phosphorylase II